MSFEGTSTVVSLANPGLVLSEAEAQTIWQEGRQDMMPQTSEDGSIGTSEPRFEGGGREELSFAEEPVSIIAADTMSAMGQAASARGYLWIPLSSPGPAHRGRLGLYIEETIENELEERGALPPGIVASTGLDASVSDQLYRARLIEMRGIALGIPSLEGITNLGRTLDADDSSVLRWWMAATADRPVRLLVSAENSKLRVYPSPVFFDALFEFAPKPVSPRPPQVDMAESAEVMALSDLPPQVALPSETNVLGTRVSESEPARSFADDSAEIADDYLLDDRRAEFAALDLALGLSGQSETTAAGEQVEVYDEIDGLLSDEVPESNQNEADKQPRDRLAVTEDEELNSDEFLRTLAEDSARAPEAIVSEMVVPVEVVVEAEAKLAAQIDAEPAHVAHEPREEAPASIQTKPSLPIETNRKIHFPEPRVEKDVKTGAVESAESRLPSNKIGRTPFIRFASSNEEAVDASTPAAAAANEVAGSDETTMTSSAAAVTRQALGADRGQAGANLLAARSVEQEAAQSEDDAHETEQPRVSAPRARVKEFDPNDPFNQLAAQKWQSWVSNLIAARGPKPLSVIERMFVTDYTRLREAVRRGVANESANEILDEWRDSFTSSYSEAYDALRVRGKRPTMVLDLPELAKRLGRLQGAKRVQLFLVDGMRFDLGLMIQDRMRKSVAASLTERLLLWSALPSVTSHQLELLGRGPDGLKDNPKPDESPTLVARGRAALTPRRVRAGNLEILKLDVVEDMLRQPGLPVLERMDEIAEIAADAISAHMEKLPERTMVIVFGDHGFALDPSAAGTTAEVRQGGASPEEVLVPAFAWLTGATH